MSSDEARLRAKTHPDMTGVVDSNFNSKVEQHATTEMQATAADLNKRFDSLQGEVDLLVRREPLTRYVSTSSAVIMKPCRLS
jgi:conjugal transfer pilus assembly protein TraB